MFHPTPYSPYTTLFVAIGLDQGESMYSLPRCRLACLLIALSVGACARTRQPGTITASSGSSAGPASVGETHVASTTVPVPGGCSVRRTGTADAIGCYMAGSEQIGPAPETPLYWHIYAYATRAAAEAVRRSRGTVAEAHGRVWLFTIADKSWQSAAGERVALVGPLPATPGRVYAAHYFEGVVPAAARTPVHRHAGPEAWFVLEGAQCLETPNGFKVVRAGESFVIPEGPPMLLVGLGSSVRRTLGLVLHDAAQPWTQPSSDWTPKEACPRNAPA
jgi:quercetin dioxygenase-like cupin family protein